MCGVVVSNACGVYIVVAYQSLLKLGVIDLRWACIIRFLKRRSNRYAELPDP